MLHDARLPLISFTGSTAVGRRVAQTVAGRFGRTILELGGNNAIVVARDAEPRHGGAGHRSSARSAPPASAAPRRAASSRIASIAGALSERLVKAYGQVPIGDPLEAGTLMGPLVTTQAVDADAGRADAGRGRGRRGALRRRPPRPDLGPQFVEPAIVRMPAQTDDRPAGDVRADPLPARVRRSSTRRIALHNGVPQGLSSAIFTESMRTAEEFLSARGSDCGIANVNIGTSGAEIGGAFGGEKETGGGRESGSDAWKAYMRRQTNTVNWSTALPLAQGITFGE